jgi:hypothetical protein
MKHNLVVQIIYIIRLLEMILSYKNYFFLIFWLLTHQNNVKSYSQNRTRLFQLVEYVWIYVEKNNLWNSIFRESKLLVETRIINNHNHQNYFNQQKLHLELQDLIICWMKKKHFLELLLSRMQTHTLRPLCIKTIISLQMETLSQE